MSAAGALGGLARGIGYGMGVRQDQRDRREEMDLRRDELAAYRARGTDFNPNAAEEGFRLDPGTSSAGRAARGVGVPYQVSSETAATEMAPYQRAFLDTIAGGESGGAYNIRYTPRGGEGFEGWEHPRIFEEGPHGKSSAAGRYQFTASTWDDEGGGGFDPKSQDFRAWGLATKRYRAATGRDLTADLNEHGVDERVLSALSPTWAAFNGNRSRHMATYRSRLDHYSGAGAPIEGEAA